MIRLVGVLLWVNGRIVQTENFHVTNTIHEHPIHAVEAIEAEDLDELAIINITGDVSSKEPFVNHIRDLARGLRIPLIAGGQISNVSDFKQLLNVGADKIICNTAVIDDPALVETAVETYGSATVVASVDLSATLAEKIGNSRIYHNRLRKPISFTLDSWLHRQKELGIGEIFFNNVEHDGARIGYDLKGLQHVIENSNSPVIAFGGVGDWSHLAEGADIGAGAVAFGNALHYVETAPRKAKLFLKRNGYAVREI